MVLEPSPFSCSKLHYFVVLDQHERALVLFTDTFVDSRNCVSPNVGEGVVCVLRLIKTRIWPRKNIGTLFFRARCHDGDTVMCTLSTCEIMLMTATVTIIVAPAFALPSFSTSDSSQHYGAPSYRFQLSIQTCTIFTDHEEWRKRKHTTNSWLVQRFYIFRSVFK